MLQDPTDITAEQLVIGGCLLTPDAVPFAAQKLDPQDFANPRNGYIYEAILELHKNREPVEPFTVHQKSLTKGAKGLNAADLHVWMHHVGSGYTVGHYAEEVRQQATTRRLNALTQRFQQEINDPQTQTSDAMQRMMHGLEEIRDNSISSGLLAKSLGEILATPDSPEDWIIPNLLEKGDRLIVTGQEGMGKTLWLRQLGITAAAGIHPTTWERLDKPAKVLYVDVENSEKQWRRETKHIAQISAEKGLEPPHENIHVHCGGRMNLTRDRDLGLVHKLVDEHQPDILFIGPIYRLAPSVNNDEEASPLIAALDTLRDRGLAMLMEAHIPKAQDTNGKRNLAPRGSSALMGWPEFGLGLAASDDKFGADVIPWRGHRDKNREWPTKLWTGTRNSYPWVPDNVADRTRQYHYLETSGGF